MDSPLCYSCSAEVIENQVVLTKVNVEDDEEEVWLCSDCLHRVQQEVSYLAMSGVHFDKFKLLTALCVYKTTLIRTRSEMDRVIDTVCRSNDEMMKSLQESRESIKRTTDTIQQHIDCCQHLNK